MKPELEFKNESWTQIKHDRVVPSGLRLLCLTALALARAAAHGTKQTGMVLRTFGKLTKLRRTRFAGNVPALVGMVWLALMAVGQAMAQDYQVLYNFPGNTGSAGRGALVTDAEGRLYGTTYAGSNVAGLVFRIKTDGTDFTVLKEFSDSANEGGLPRWLVISGNTLYGTAMSGGATANGMLFRMNTDGSAYTVLQRFYGTNGASPVGLVLDGTTLYGATVYGGDANHGGLYRINTDGSGFSVIKSFSGDDGGAPFSLVISSNTLYGITREGSGTIFNIQTDGTSHRVLRQLDGPTDGGSPGGCLLLSGTTLYGSAQGGGALDGGTIFRIETDGSGFVVLKSVGASDEGYSPHSGLVMLGSTLYGTMGDGPNQEGTIYQISTNGSDFTVLKRLGGADGIRPWATMCLVGSSLFGTTEIGGLYNSGVVFTLSIAPPRILAAPESQTAEVGTSVDFAVQADEAKSLIHYRWFFDGGDITNVAATNDTLKLPNVQPVQAGSYTVVVMNDSGAVTSAPALLNVIAPVVRRWVPGVNLLGQPGSFLGLDYRNNLGSAANWETMATLTLSNSSQFYFDLTEPLPPQRFFRAWQSGTPGVVPSLDLHMVPAITLTGNLGSKMRVDGINQFGPTGDWFPLDTVTLTNTSHLYFDVSVIGQPARLYRLVPVP